MTIMEAGSLQNFECPVCMEYFQKPIFQCASGHSFCTDCKVKLKKCPYCSGSFSYTRNYVLENILSSVTVPCKNEFCTEILPLDKYAEHAKVCMHVECKVPNCAWKDSKSLINDHIKTWHKGLMIQEYVKIETHQFTISFIEYDGNIFCIKRGIDDGFITWTAEPTTQIPTADLAFVVKVVTPTGDYHFTEQPVLHYGDSAAVKSTSNLGVLKSKVKGCKFQFSVENITLPID